ncbi:Sodium/hydrogen exchanger family-domain-containing protein [Crucibulum laeve]|uniref:Sodium/hydrogen exchanger family-domain-containing protein n=1 Tax=Crucibulum laeve TaxID=68775 RepID=A0A5C3MEX5_9AGAR|nr:Sodium/hydrogen exchanger family-domain-containing protein [Crucibulum laeve]
MGEFSHQVVTLFSRAASEQGGVISGDNPTHYNASDPFRLWVIQVVIIIAMAQFLSLCLARIRQPRVIAEVIGGVLLGPTVMGRIPGFRQAIFPDAGMPLLTLTSTIGLVFFLFLVGLEIDTRVIKRNIRASAYISVAGLVVPLGLGAALGVGVYREFINPDVNFGYFLLFTAVAIGITAFPVLCRILTELELLDTTVGVVVLSAGVGNDVVGWILLALVVALVNASSGLTALWVLLASVGYVILLLYPGRWAFVWLARRTGSLEQGSPTAFMMTVTILVVLISAFFTDIIGVHAIFGGFLAGLIIPHENGFAISLVEKLEDLVSILFLPVYFILSGLRTNLGLLDNGITWGYTIIICLVAFTSKFVSCGIAAYTNGFNWREAGAIGSLMSCKGLVELIVLNIGLQANILDTRTFSMFVVHALILTFMTTPLTLAFYPPKHRIRAGSNRERPSARGDEAAEGGGRHVSDENIKSKFALVLDKIEQLPAAMTIAQLLQMNNGPSPTNLTPISSNEKEAEAYGTIIPSLPGNNLDGQPRITIDALRLIELTTRTSAVLRSQEAESLIYNDPVVSVFRTFGYLNRLLVSAALSVVNYDEFPAVISKHVADLQSDMVILPWSRGTTSVLEEDGHEHSRTRNPFDGIFHKTTTQDQTSSVVYSEFIRNVFASSPSDVGLFVDREMSMQYAGAERQRLFLPFFGGPDDRLALTFLVQLCSNPNVTAKVIWIRKSENLSPRSTRDDDPKLSAAANAALHNTIAGPDTVYPNHNTQTRLASDTADNIVWDRFTAPSSAHDPIIASALSRIEFSTHSSSQPLHTLTELVKNEVRQAFTPRRTLIVVAGRSRRMAVESHSAELRELIAEIGSSISSSVPKTVGDVGAALVASNVNASLLILQASSSSV